SLPSGQTSVWRVLSTFRRSHKYVALLQKELQLQQVSFFIALLLLLAHLGSLLLREFIPHQTRSALWMVIDNAWILWLALPLFVGSMAVAEERRLGTLDDLLTQPVSRRGKFAVKLIVTFVLALFFGTVMPWAIEKLFHIPRVLAFDLMHDTTRADLAKMTLWIVSCAFFASAAARNSIEAICLGTLAVPLAFALMNALAVYYSAYVAEIAGLLVLLSAFWLAWRNFSRAQIRLPDIAITLATLAIAAATGWGVASFTWNRGWEYFMRLEPEHGAPVLRVTDHVKIASSSFGPIALLPDGRIWMATYEYHWRAVSKSRKTDEVLSAVTVTNARFIPGTWKDFAIGPDIYAIKPDGTLWQLTDVKFHNRTRFRASELNPPKQVGTDSDWASLSGGRSYILALKRDGSLWGCGDNDFGQLGPGPKRGARIPRPLWPGSAWSRVLTADYQCLGFKKDGTSWEWGGLNRYETHLDDVFPPFEPQPSVFEGTNWTSYFASFPVHFARRDDGTLWSAIPDKSLTVIKSPWSIFGQPVTIEKGLHRLGTGADWRLLTARHPMSALKEDGTWLVHDGSCVGRQRSEGVRVSRYTDWITVSSDFDVSKAEIIGIAVDGTISSWMSLDSYPYNLGPSHRPAWSANIFHTQTASR
ncbi:MAG: ABC transporter permease, partial [Limisphaerales bacterium]